MTETLTPCDKSRAEDATITKAIESEGERVAQVGQGHWRVLLRNGRAHATTALYRKPWLTLNAPLGRDDENVPTAWDLVTRHTRLPRATRYALRGGVPCVTAEAPVIETDRLASRVRELCRGLRTGAANYHGDDAEAPSPKEDLKADTEPFPALCAEAGWPCVQRATGDHAVPLDGLGPNASATLENGQGDGPRLWVPLLALPETPEDGATARALALLLLTVSGRTRLARPVLRVRSEGADLGFTAPLWAPLQLEEVVCALGAIHVACRLCAREMTALKDARLAERYLALRGWPIKEAS